MNNYFIYNDFMSDVKVVSEKLNTYKKRLLDLTARNRMIHSNFQSRTKLHFRFIDELPNQLFKKLKGGMDFLSLPEPEGDPQDEDTIEFKNALEIAMLSDQEYIDSIKAIEENEDDNFNEESEVALRSLKNKVRRELGMPQFNDESFSIIEHARFNNINPSYDLPYSDDEDFSEAERHNDKKIQTLMLPETLKSYVRSIFSRYKIDVREYGVNPLFICFGFLEWTESASSDVKRYSPLLCLQVEFDETNKRNNLRIVSAGDEISINHSLDQRLKKDFDLNLPEIHSEEGEEDEEGEEAGINIENYLKEVQKKVADKKNWKVRNWASFGIYPSQLMPIYLDVENLEESNFSDLLEDLVIGGFLDDKDSISSDLYDIDDEEISSHVPALINPADASQFSAIYDVVRGNNLVIKGPPGTGKSQTITNMIAALMFQGKSVLFVAQKQAALDVVKNNLIAAGFEKYLLEVFSVKGKRKIMQSLEERLNTKKPKEPKDFFKKFESLHKIKQRLNEHAKILGSEFGETQTTVHNIIWDIPEVDFEIPAELQDQFKSFDAFAISEDQLKNDIDNLKFLKNEHEKTFNTEDENKLEISQIKKIISNPLEIKEIEKDIKSIADVITPVEEKFTKQLDINPFLNDLSDKDYQEGILNLFYSSGGVESGIWKIVRLASTQNGQDLIFDLLKARNEYKEHIDNYAIAKEFINRNFDLENNLYSNNEIKKAIVSLKNTHIFSFLFSQWRQARNLFNDLYKKNEKPKGKDAAKLLTKYLAYIENKQVYKTNIDRSLEQINSISKKIVEQENLLDKDSLNQFDDSLFTEVISFIKKVDDKFINYWISEPNTIIEYIDLLNECEKNINPNVNKLLTRFDLELGPKIIDDIRFLINLKNSPVTLSVYMSWLNTKHQFEKKELIDFHEAFTMLGLENKNIENVYKNIVRKRQHKAIYDQYPELGEFRSDLINKYRHDLAKFDHELLDLSKDIVASKTHSQQSNAPEGNSSGRVIDKTDMGLINHIAGQERGRTTIRQMFKRAGDAAISLKPCTLMSPLAVSQTLELKEIYDVLIIDEASQMRPELSLPAIARSRQVIIVGDEKQLPPYDGFRKISEEDENDEDFADESILDMALTVLKSPRELLYHYRSKHEDLIRFSNYEFYKNLMIPVTASPDHPNKGIKNIFLEDGRYLSSSSGGSGGINPTEAERVVDEVIKLMETRPRESIGVATMNVKQTRLIENIYQLKRNENQKIRAYERFWQEEKDGLNEFFIKNLENVQGDERDTIVISTVYGPHSSADEPRGKVMQRFGDINKENGWRRLNVLFTRAKNQIILVTSLLPGDIDDKGKKRGVQVLKKYLAYAEKPDILEGVKNTSDIESPFQKWAIDQINALDGFSCDWEIGVRGYRIDIGVKHKDYPNGYILAVETDGASYHSSVSARDRDYQRQKILEGYGWHFHRIWSTDWLYDPLSVKEKLYEAMNGRLKKCLEELAEHKKLEQESKQENAHTDNFDLSNEILSIEYSNTKVADWMNIDKSSFTKDSYKDELRKGIDAIIRIESPISLELLVEKIRKAHGFSRAGQEIRETINSLIVDKATTSHNEQVFIWSDEHDCQNHNLCRYPLEGYRDIDDIAPEEIKVIKKHLEEQVDKDVKNIGYYLGYSQVTSNTLNKIKEKLI
tara:strand:+ start:967 stop:5934 length:4968 start_codon:yes stop_codon:yes gene_type:complete